MITFKSIHKPFIVAEIGNNHEGSVISALKLIKSAKDSGADAVKFQIFNPLKYSSPKDKDRIRQLNKFVLKKKDIIRLKKECDKLKITFFATPFDTDSAKFLNGIQNFFKISSGDNNFNELLETVRSFKKPVIISTGLLDFSEIKKVVKYFRELNYYKKKENICIMHCVSAYPASNIRINLNSIPFLKKKLPNVTVGYSDHTMGYKVSCLSYALGAEIIEKHFTLSNNFSNFRDHKISLNPETFKKFTKEIKNLKKIFGNYSKEVNLEEKKNLFAIRRKVISNKNIKKGSKVKKNDLLIVRSKEPGLFASKFKIFLGKKLIKNIKKFENFEPKHFIK